MLDERTIPRWQVCRPSVVWSGHVQSILSFPNILWPATAVSHLVDGSGSHNMSCAIEEHVHMYKHVYLVYSHILEYQ